MTDADPGDNDRERAKTIHNETAKLAATYTNGLAIAIFAVGGLTAPLNSISQGHPFPDSAPLVIASFFVSLSLHYLARTFLRTLR